jgi:hypothetical protein
MQPFVRDHRKEIKLNICIKEMVDQQVGGNNKKAQPKGCVRGMKKHIIRLLQGCALSINIVFNE